MKKLLVFLGLMIIMVISIPVMASPIYDDVGEQITVTVDDMVSTPVTQEVGTIEDGGLIAVWSTYEYSTVWQRDLSLGYTSEIDVEPYSQVSGNNSMTLINNKEKKNRYLQCMTNDTNKYQISENDPYKKILVEYGLRY